ATKLVAPGVRRKRLLSLMAQTFPASSVDTSRIGPVKPAAVPHVVVGSSGPDETTGAGTNEAPEHPARRIRAGTSAGRAFGIVGVSGAPRPSPRMRNELSSPRRGGTLGTLKLQSACLQGLRARTTK